MIDAIPFSLSLSLESVLNKQWKSIPFQPFPPSTNDDDGVYQSQTNDRQVLHHHSSLQTSPSSIIQTKNNCYPHNCHSTTRSNILFQRERYFFWFLFFQKYRNSNLASVQTISSGTTITIHNVVQQGGSPAIIISSSSMIYLPLPPSTHTHAHTTPSLPLSTKLISIDCRVHYSSQNRRWRTDNSDRIKWFNTLFSLSLSLPHVHSPHHFPLSRFLWLSREDAMDTANSRGDASEWVWWYFECLFPSLSDQSIGESWS